MNAHFAPINPGYINTARIRGQLLAANMKAARRWKKMLALYTATWENPPEFKAMFGYKGGNLWFSINTDDPVFWYLEFGTDVRYATMSENFVPKTAPGQLVSGQGQGQVSYVNNWIPRPGIEARHILEEIANIDVNRWESDIQNIFANIRFTSTKESHLG